MTTRAIWDMTIPIGDILRSAGSEGVLLEQKGRQPYAVLPLDDDVIDFLLERNPAFIKECRQIQKEMKAGHFVTHEQLMAETEKEKKAK